MGKDDQAAATLADSVERTRLLRTTKDRTIVRAAANPDPRARGHATRPSAWQSRCRAGDPRDPGGAPPSTLHAAGTAASRTRIRPVPRATDRVAVRLTRTGDTDRVVQAYP